MIYKDLITLEDWNQHILAVRELLNEMGLEVTKEEEFTPHNNHHDNFEHKFYLVYQDHFSCMFVQGRKYEKYPKYYFKPSYAGEGIYMAFCSNTNDLSRLEQELRHMVSQMIQNLLK